jgi:23S rRNA (uracil1939-C5)-methyltransferase
MVKTSFVQRKKWDTEIVSAYVIRMMKQNLEIQFEKIGRNGNGVGRAPDGRPVFAALTAPGDFARVEILEDTKRYFRTRIVELLTPSPDRVTPRCPLFGECVGCQLQHIRYAVQWSAKQAALWELLAAHGVAIESYMAKGVAAPQEWNYRNHVQFSLAKDGRLGFPRVASPRVMPVEQCFLPEASLEALRREFDWEPIPGVRQVGFRAGEDGDMIVLESDTGEAPEALIEADISFAMLDPDGEANYLAGGPLHFSALGKVFRVSAGSAFPICTDLIPAMVERVLEYAGIQSGDTALDLYSGVGLWAAFLAERAARTIAVEDALSAVEDFQVNLAEFDTVELYAASAEQALPAMEGRVSAAVATLARGGFSEPGLAALLRLAPERLVIVSSDTHSLARDAIRLQTSGYRLREITPVDLSPQTYHLDAISLWRKE